MIAAVTNVDVGAAIGLAHSTVSRIRSGERVPSIDIMMEIDKQYGWSIAEQAKARADGDYAPKFEEILVKKYGSLATA